MERDQPVHARRSASRHPGPAALGVVLATGRIDVLPRWFQKSVPPVAGPALAAADTLAIGLFFTLAVLSVAAGSYSPFLYFRF